MSLLGVEGVVVQPVVPAQVNQDVPVLEVVVNAEQIALEEHAFPEVLRTQEVLRAPSLPEEPGVITEESEGPEGKPRLTCSDYYQRIHTDVHVPEYSADAEGITLIRRSRFGSWDPLKTKDKIEVKVIDVGSLDHMCGNGIGSRISFPEGYFEHGGEIADLLRSAASSDVLDVSLEVVDQSKTSVASYLSSLNDELERTGRKLDMVNMSIGIVVPLEQGVLFTPRFRRITGLSPQYLGVDEDLRQVERLARNTNGPVFISAGNSGDGTLNVYRFAQGPNIVIVGATTDDGEIATYSSVGADVYANGDLSARAICDKDGTIEGVKVVQGGHEILFKDALPSFKWVHGKQLKEVHATSWQRKRFTRSLLKESLGSLPERYSQVVFDSKDVAAIREVVQRTTAEHWWNRLIPSRGEAQNQEVVSAEDSSNPHDPQPELTVEARLSILEEFMAVNDAVVDAETLYNLALAGSRGLEGRVLGLYWNSPTGLSLSKTCDEGQLYFPMGTSYSAPKVGVGFITQYLEERGRLN